MATELEVQRVRFLRMLPSHIRTLFDSIEAFTGKLIHVVDTVPRGISAPACKIDAAQAILFLGNPATDNIQSITHELLHIRRRWVEGIPQFALKPSSNSSSLHAIAAHALVNHFENTLEHLNIVPREAEYGFDPYPFRNSMALQAWRSFNPQDTRSFGELLRCLQQRLVLNYVTDPLVQEVAFAYLRKVGLFDVAEQFNERILRCNANKNMQAANVASAFEVPPHLFQLTFCDARTNSTTSRDLPIITF